ncbi:GNAT family N-acetyltransferase [Glutamicibacter arilaitensis]|uniref:N-acetyltransferase domain-containing protein n=1 Tax=Glutamicibacter arilaitensis TaxID=256701 RepID=A0A2N7S1K9_9MICC|nr:hypothetical protein CIK84_15305 [Glutamicibacter arilaitensis]
MLRLQSITLRPFRSADTEFFASMASDERVTRFIGHGRPWDRQTINACVQESLHPEPLHTVGASRWFLATEANTEVGLVFCTRQETCVEVGYWVSPDQWGRGVGGAMLDRTLISIPKIYGITKFSARVAPDNTVSARLLTSRGFRLEKRDDKLEYYILD